MAEGPIPRMGFRSMLLTVLVSIGVAAGVSWYLYNTVDTALQQHTTDLLQDGESRFREYVLVLAARSETLAQNVGFYILSSEEVTAEEWDLYVGLVSRATVGTNLFDALVYAPREADGSYRISLASPLSASEGLLGIDISHDARFAEPIERLRVTGLPVQLGRISYGTQGPVSFSAYPVTRPGGAEPDGVILLRRLFGSQLLKIVEMFNDDPDVIGIRLSTTDPTTGDPVSYQNDAFGFISDAGIGHDLKFSFIFGQTDFNITLVAPHGMGVPSRDRNLQYLITLGAFISVLGAMITLTALYRSRRELAREIVLVQKAKKAVDEFASLASHQMKAPLTALRWNVEVLLDKATGPLNETQRPILADIGDAVSRMTKLINSLLSVGRVESGTFAAVPEPLDVVSTVHAYVSDNTPAAVSRKQNVTEEYEQDLPKVQMDPQLLGAIVQNLISNAIRYTKPGGNIAVRVHQKEGAVRISVTDTGIGIPAEAMKTLWDKGFRTAEAASMEAGGTGLGLYMVKNVIDETGGTITVQSEVGKGSTFTVSYPMTGMKARSGTKSVEVPLAEEVAK